MRTLCVLTFVLVASLAQAQTASPGNQLTWTQAGQSQATAQSATYTLYDGTTPIPVPGVTCVANGADADCSAPVPALTAGSHTVALTQVLAGAESTKSNPLTFQFVIVVTPTKLSLK